MTNRERIIATALCQKTDRLPFFFVFGPWAEVEGIWRGQGLAEGKHWDSDMGFDPGIAILPVNLGYCPAFEWKVLEDRQNTQIVVDHMGVTQEINKLTSSIPRYIDYPVKDKESWEKVKNERLNPESPERFSASFDAAVAQFEKEDKALQIGAYPYGLFGTLRDMMGVEELLVSFYEQPELIHEMMDYLTDFWLTIYGKVCSKCRVDIIHIWEDMSGRTGSLISPDMVRGFMLPNYKKIKAFADKNDIKVITLDTDGDVSQLTPLFIEAGINLLFPFEVQAGCDIKEYRRLYPNLGILGGINKMEISKGKEATDSELKRLDYVFSKPGYFPSLDHLIPPDLSYPDYLYFVKKLKELCFNKGKAHL